MTFPAHHPTPPPDPRVSGTAREIADETIAYWQAHGIGSEEAWRAMGLPWGWGVQWFEVRALMVRLMLAEHHAIADERLAA